MKKSRLVLCTFSLVSGLFSQGAFSKTISLESISDSEYDHVKVAVQQRPEFHWSDGRDTYRVRFESGNSYLLSSSVMLRSNPNFKGKGYPGGRGWCEFDFFDQNYKFVNGIRVNIRDHGDTNVCNWIEGVSAVTFKGQPALLTTVQYHRGIDPARTIDEIGKGYHDFTALLVLTPNPDGSLSIRQDDSCLGAMNQIGELAVARKRIAECNQ